VHSRKGFSKLSEYIPRAVNIFRRWLSNDRSIASPSLIIKNKNNEYPYLLLTGL